MGRHLMTLTSNGRRIHLRSTSKVSNAKDRRDLANEHRLEKNSGGLSRSIVEQQHYKICVIVLQIALKLCTIIFENCVCEHTNQAGPWLELLFTGLSLFSSHQFREIWRTRREEQRESIGKRELLRGNYWERTAEKELPSENYMSWKCK